MFGIIDIGTYIIGTILIVILPGPNSLYVMSIASRFGIKTGYWGALGVFTGDLILILCTVLGAASLLHAFPWLFILLKIVGALYLSYLGIKLLIADKNCRRTLSVIFRYKTLDCRSQNMEVQPTTACSKYRSEYVANLTSFSFSADH